jgi:hypothetical protein
MAPDSLVRGGTRSADLLNHDRMTARRTIGLEAALVDFEVKKIESALNPDEFIEIKVAGPAALLVAKAHKIYERKDSPNRMQDKDALDVYRILVAFETADLLPKFELITENPISRSTTLLAIEYLKELFIIGNPPIGSEMVRRAVSSLGNADEMAQAVKILVSELIKEIKIN